MARHSIKSVVPSKKSVTKPTSIRTASQATTSEKSVSTVEINQKSVSSRFYSRPYWTRIRRIYRSHTTHVLALVILAVVGCLFFFHLGQQSNDSSIKSAGKLQTTSAVVERVSRHILLPSGEQPTVATVTDASKVRNQAFFSSSASGDKVLIYAQAKKAYLYRPSIDRVIEVAPLAPNTGDQTSSP